MFDSVMNFFGNMFDKISSFFTSGYDLALVLISVVLAFVIFKFLKYLTVPSIIISQILMLTISISSMILFVGLLATSLVSIYNRIFDLATHLAGLSTASSCLAHYLSLLGIDGILSSFFTELFAILITVLFIRVSSHVLWAFNFISERIWRIGVLLGLAS